MKSVTDALKNWNPQIDASGMPSKDSLLENQELAIAALSRYCRELEVKNGRLKAANEELLGFVEEDAAEIKELEAENERLKNEHIDTIVLLGTDAERIEELEAENEQLKDELTEWGNIIERLERENAALSAQVKRLETELDRLYQTAVPVEGRI